MTIEFNFSSIIDAPLEKVWAFHEADDALEKLTPPDAPIEVVRRDVPMQKGSEVLLAIGKGPFKLHWLALHTEWDPPHSFTDIQVKGPFRSWEHTHRFEVAGAGTKMSDQIVLELKGGKVVEWLLGWLVRWGLRRMFSERHEALRSWFKSD